ncbi:MAG TPA: type 1 glutamine amidotransferase domain-containing protein [Actinomycetales bacterium]|nr:type 1 glutamine amidotransferase domain-containing protein [Actinomycetales bacterium]
MSDLTGMKIGMLIEDEYEILEAWYPKLRLEEAGATVVVIGSGKKDQYGSKEHYPMPADAAVEAVNAADLDGIIVPGGYAPDHMRLHPEMIQLVRDVHAAEKLVASICHGGWILASADVLRNGRTVTAYGPIKDDLVNAGGNFVDKEVAVDGHVVTSRTPADLVPFMKAILAQLESQK